MTIKKAPHLAPSFSSLTRCWQPRCHGDQRLHRLRSELVILNLNLSIPPSNIHWKARKEPRSWREEATEAPRLKSALSYPPCCSLAVMRQSRGPQRPLGYCTLCQTLFTALLLTYRTYLGCLCRLLDHIKCPTEGVLHLDNPPETQKRKNNVLPVEQQVIFLLTPLCAPRKLVFMTM